MKIYNITKINSQTGEEFNMGTWNEEDMKLITRGYSFNGMFYDRKNSKWFFTVDEVKRTY